ncbi:ArsR/SmtB family transcription factor [Salinisphaera sp. SWV1]|uniref:ArsR/SmtB family transcription factor n=1 Tax=Salinisphaera sp. SWV1 TaxID=3454139 RepID=UPI003F833E9D
MDEFDAIECFSALAQQTRLAAFRLLVRHEPNGLPAGEIARLLDVPHNTMSAHLAVLTRAGLAMSQRRSRSIVYRADLTHMQDTVRFLVRDCCAGRPEICEPLLDSLAESAPAPDNRKDPPCNR